MTTSRFEHLVTLSGPVAQLYVRHVHRDHKKPINAELLQHFVDAVCALNALADGYYVRAGQVLTIPETYASCFQTSAALRPVAFGPVEVSAPWQSWQGVASGERAAALFATAMADGAVTPDEMNGESLSNVRIHAKSVLTQRGVNSAFDLFYVTNASGYICGVEVVFPRELDKQRFEGLAKSTLCSALRLRHTQVRVSVRSFHVAVDAVLGTPLSEAIARAEVTASRMVQSPTVRRV